MHLRLNPERSGTTRLHFAQNAHQEAARECVYFVAGQPCPPFPLGMPCMPSSLAGAVPNEPDSRTCAFRGRPVRTCLAQRRLRWACDWADFIAERKGAAAQWSREMLIALL